MLLKKAVTWIVVADGARAQIVRQAGVGAALEPVPGQEFINPSQERTRDLGTDRPGRSADSGGNRHGMKETDWHQQGKRRFARTIAERLERRAEAKAFDRLVLVAPPETLGELRANLGKHASARLGGEIPKDLTQVTVGELADHLLGVVRVAS